MSKHYRSHLTVAFLALSLNAVVLAGQLWSGAIGQAASEPMAEMAEMEAETDAPHSPALSLSTVNPAALPMWADHPDSTPLRIQQALAAGHIDAATADLYLAFALRGDDRLPSEYVSEATWHGTAYLARLRQTAQAKLAAPERQAAPEIEVYSRIAALLSSICNNYDTTLPNELNTAHFNIQYNSIGGGLTINDYATSLERAWETEITKFGWPKPPVAINPAAGNRLHVRIDLAKQPGLYGLTSFDGTHAGPVGDNPNTPWRETDAEAACLVLNRDFSKFDPTPALQALNATTAHEFVHVVHYGVGIDNDLTGNGGLTFAEAMATMMEDEVMNESNDNYNYLWPKLDMCLGAYSDSPYKYWVVMRAMTERFGTGAANGAEQVLQDFFTVLSQGQAGRLSAFNQGFVNKGTTLANAFHDAAISLRFVKPCGGNYAQPHCLNEANGYINHVRSDGSAIGLSRISTSKLVNGTISQAGGAYTGTVENHYAMNWVDLPLNTAPYAVTLQNNSATGEMRMSVVCDTGTAFVLSPSPVVSGKKSGGVANVDPAGCVKITAIITNQKVTSEAPRTCTADPYVLSTGSALPQNNFKVYFSFIRK